jgi:hypothetical protein
MIAAAGATSSTTSTTSASKRSGQTAGKDTAALFLNLPDNHMKTYGTDQLQLSRYVPKRRIQIQTVQNPDDPGASG